MREAWHKIANDALARLGIDDEAIGVEIGDRHYELRESLRAPFPRAIETLSILRTKGVTLGLITNGDGPGQRAKIERFALAVHFAYIGIEGEVGHGKPSRQAYEAALLLSTASRRRPGWWATISSGTWRALRPLASGASGLD